MGSCVLRIRGFPRVSSPCHAPAIVTEVWSHTTFPAENTGPYASPASEQPRPPTWRAGLPPVRLTLPYLPIPPISVGVSVIDDLAPFPVATSSISCDLPTDLSMENGTAGSIHVSLSYLVL
jgi:hypothetical protein